MHGLPISLGLQRNLIFVAVRLPLLRDLAEAKVDQLAARSLTGDDQFVAADGSRAAEVVEADDSRFTES